ncbi:Succinate dehydrogenase assembly factor 4, mitochondrial [Psilocybe cubensis]|uniref:Succinate dehydrogenase assembly factor 4, mitochondrial n=2 Tax=Psilocybe cubensis TaxID=181762 RepID=A0ACB8HC40_PSICU|nr:Succinate dehydrogenase assembly factor 4, mitochondrial [Psilocybe cubensis]KAH9485431.1 Succinate dehydrogenase assembly factor 4, mitochondrial [Psilocybe cubensis]
MFSRPLLKSRSVLAAAIARRTVSINRPAPLPLPQDDQREYELLLRNAQTPLAPSNDLAVHPDARTPITPEFEGDVNPTTGELGGPKREPVNRWAADPGGDWSFKGRVSDF